MPITTSSKALDPTKVLLTGDTMTGLLTVTSGGLLVTGGTITNDQTVPGVVATFGNQVGLFQSGKVMQINAHNVSTLSNNIAIGCDMSAGQTSIVIGVTGNPSHFINYSGSRFITQFTPGQLRIEDNLATFSGTFLNLKTTGYAGGGGVFANWTTTAGEQFKVDTAGNMLIGGAYISPRFGPGRRENLLLHSEDFTDAVWTAAGVTMTGPDAPGPDGAANEATTYTATATTNEVSQLMTTATAANNTFTAQGWVRRTNVGGQTLRGLLSDSTGSEESPWVHFGLTGNENKWEFRSLTYAFTGAAVGSPLLKLFSGVAATTAELFGFAVSQGAAVVAYAPTGSSVAPSAIGSSLSGALRLVSIATPTKMEICKSPNQGATPLKLYATDAGVMQRAVTPDFHDHFLDGIKNIYGTTNQGDIYHDGTDLIIDPDAVGAGIALVTGDMKAGTPTRTESTAYTVTAKDEFVLCDATGGAFIVTLPAVATSAGFRCIVKKTDISANAITVDGNAAETIDDALTAVLTAQYEAVTFICDGVEWWIV